MSRLRRACANKAVLKRSAIAVALLLAGLQVVAANAGALEDAEAGLDAGLRGDYGKAAELFSRAIESGEVSGSDLAVVLYRRGVAFERMNHEDRAIADYGQAIELNPEYSDAYYEPEPVND